MFNVLGDINWIGVVLATLASTVLGGVWFAALVAKPYARALGRDPEQSVEMSGLAYGGPMLCTLFTVVASALLVEALDIKAMSDSIVFGLIVGIGYLAATMTNVAINPNFPRPLAYAAVNAPFFTLSGLASSVILVAMR